MAHLMKASPSAATVSADVAAHAPLVTAVAGLAAQVAAGADATATDPVAAPYAPAVPAAPVSAASAVAVAACLQPPAALIIGSSMVRHVSIKGVVTLWYPGALASDIDHLLPIYTWSDPIDQKCGSHWIK